MNNPFIHKSNNGLLTAGFAFGALAAGALTWLYFKSKETDELTEHLDAPYHKQPDRKKKHKSDVSGLHTVAPAKHGE
jgi:hypothetical protein